MRVQNLKVGDKVRLFLPLGPWSLQDSPNNTIDVTVVKVSDRVYFSDFGWAWLSQCNTNWITKIVE